jgi:uncharacterized protein (DUF302 family)
MTPAGLLSRPSHFDPQETMRRAINAVIARGMSVMARINHATAAAEVGLTLRPTEVILFGSPKAGTPLMQAAQTMGIDLPLKILVWEDDSARTWLSYNDPTWLADRHGLGAEHAQTVTAMGKALAAIADEATRDPSGRSSGAGAP